MNEMKPRRFFLCVLGGSSPGAMRRFGTALDVPPQLSASLSVRRKRVLRMSQQRGMLENELLVGSFVLSRIASLSDQQLSQLETVLSLQDPDLFHFLSGKRPLPEELRDNAVLLALMQHAREDPLAHTRRAV